MTAPTYPRIHQRLGHVVMTGPDTDFVCSNSYEAQAALRALQDAFAAGQRSMIERKDDEHL